MADHEMLNLDEMGTLKDSMELLGEELMNGHRKEGFVTPQVKVS